MNASSFSPSRSANDSPLEAERGRSTVTRSETLRMMLQSPELEFLMEAHNGLSARIVREAGFKGIWEIGRASCRERV